MAEERYGHIDLENRSWAGANTWLTSLDVSGLGLKWTIMDTGKPVRHILCNADMHIPLLNALQAVKAQGMGDLLKTFDGCFNIRAVRGSSLFSTHAYGLGIDINAEENPLGSHRGGFYDHPAFVKCFTDQGFDWGGGFHGRKDPMHFSFAWE
jgi:hypothetical protein